MAYRRTVGRSRTSTRSRRGSASGRRHLWVRHTEVSPVGTIANYGIRIVPDSKLDPGRRIGSTVLRCHIVIEILGAELTSASGGWFFGLAVMDVTEFATSSTPPELPIVNNAPNNGVDWMAWGYRPFSHKDVGSSVVASTRSTTWELDVKSKRVIALQGENLVFVLQNNGYTGTTGVNFVSSVLLYTA